MLYWIWFIGLSLLGWLFAYRQFRLARVGNDAESQARANSARLLSWGSMLLSLLVSWNGVGSHVYQWLDTAVPQAGTDIHAFTVKAIITALCISWIIYPALIARLLSGPAVPTQSR